MRPISSLLQDLQIAYNRLNLFTYGECLETSNYVRWDCEGVRQVAAAAGLAIDAVDVASSAETTLTHELQS